MTAAQGEGAAPDVLRLYSHFGAFNLKTEDVIAFPSGLPGFEADRRFVLLSAASFEPVQCLQSIDGPSPSFLVVDRLGPWDVVRSVTIWDGVTPPPLPAFKP